MAGTVPGFLRIALETRLQIYTIVLDQRLGYNPPRYFAISEVSKQMRREVLRMLLDNCKYFHSLELLAKWTAKGPSHLLPMVSNISVHIFEDSLLPIANTPRRYIADSTCYDPSTAEWWEAEYARRAPMTADEIPRHSWLASFLDSLTISEQKVEYTHDPRPVYTAWKAFTSISEVRKIWILLKDGSYPNPTRRLDLEQQLLLDMMAATFTRLQELSVFSNLISLEYISKFHDLRTLRFTGYSTSTPAETADILCSLTKLETIIIYRYPDHSDKNHSIITSELPRYLSLTAEVIAKLHPLKRVEVHHMASTIPSQHVTIPVMKALQAHINCLRSLYLGPDAPLDCDVIRSIIQFTASSRLHDLQLRLVFARPITHLDLSTVLPSTIKHGEVSLTQKLNPQFAYAQMSYLEISSSRSCLSNTKTAKTCMCSQKTIGTVPAQ
ncbi:hypothetical protein ONS95_002504 [Cadophora gregata]|uniref:uncharacterized protein n=1 Tax=Cadophora gregata TaxID=51156 RepID=UPI0026DD9853|nr:uncharacterized protein ONS95_002504 [Cadophora gregata]KAK0109833.1 hypothetical protein ONS95_002504 [Cadophora gregata]KAK0110542.1 hypothetical protein ONS96_002148 [Cadophora gregata f. sp. sojae]